MPGVEYPGSTYPAQYWSGLLDLAPLLSWQPIFPDRVPHRRSVYASSRTPRPSSFPLPLPDPCVSPAPDPIIADGDVCAVP